MHIFEQHKCRCRKWKQIRTKKSVCDKYQPVATWCLGSCVEKIHPNARMWVVAERTKNNLTRNNTVSRGSPRCGVSNCRNVECSRPKCVLVTFVDRLLLCACTAKIQCTMARACARVQFISPAAMCISHGKISASCVCTCETAVFFCSASTAAATQNTQTSRISMFPTGNKQLAVIFRYFSFESRINANDNKKTECWFIYVTKCVPVDAPSNSTYTTRTLIRPKMQWPRWARGSGYHMGNAQKLNERSARNCDELRCACMRNNFYECLIHSFVLMLNSKSPLKC